MENRIVAISDADAKKIVVALEKDDSCLVVSIQGKDIQNWEGNITEIEEHFQLPSQFPNNFDAYEDWMCDLEWLDKDGYALFIMDYPAFLREDEVLKQQIVNEF